MGDRRTPQGKAFMRFWSVYLLRCADDTLYCGVTTDVARRVAMHNGALSGGAKYTRARRPVTLVACADGFSYSEALRLERKVKRLPRERKTEVLRLAAAREGD